MSLPQHQSDSTILDRRRLATDHRALAALLAPGMAVLDVGCGTGAITRGIAEAVGPAGHVVGVDRDPGLLERARANTAAFANLRIEEGDATRLHFDRQFDVVTAARTLQWIANPREALRCMTRAAKAGGTVVVLDYDHAHNAWDPAPPPDFLRLYSAFLAWRESNGWDNEMASHCPALFRDAGLEDVRVERQDEVTTNGDSDFAQKSRLWLDVIEHLGPAMEQAGACDAALLASGRATFETWRLSGLVRQTLALQAIAGRVPRG